MSAQESRTTNAGWVGQTMRGKYRIVGMLGAGGWGAVYEAEHLLLRRTVAIKVLHPDIAADPKLAERFRREAMAASRIGHPNIIEVLDMDRTDDGTEFMVLELLRGESLGEALESRGAMPIAATLRIMEQIAGGLAAAHRAGIVHRDMKPDNVFLVKQANGAESVKLLDFGIAKLSPLLSDSQSTITHTGAVLGTPFYMPPEQARGDKALDHRADIFSLGVMMYETLTGAPPFEADNLPSLVMKIMFDEPVSLEKKRVGVPPGLDDLVLRMLAKEPDNRPASCEEILETLRAISSGSIARNTDADATVVGGRADVDVALSGSGDRDDDDDDDDDNDTMVMQSPLHEIEPVSLVAPLVSTEQPTFVISDSVARGLPKAPPSAARPAKTAPVEGPIATAATVRPPTSKPASLPPSPPSPPSRPSPPSTHRSAPPPVSRSVAPSRGEPTDVVRTERNARVTPPMSNLKLAVLVVIGFTSLMTLSYWVVSHL